MSLVLAGLSIRADLAGMSSFVRGLGLKPKVYRRLLHLFHTPGLDLAKLTETWTTLVLIGDGLRVAKEGKKMPAVKKLHQSSENNSKPAYIFGHSFQALGLLVGGPLGHLCCVPLISRIHEGVVFTNRDQRTLLDKFAQLFLQLVGPINAPTVLIVDAYYASPKCFVPFSPRPITSSPASNAQPWLITPQYNLKYVVLAARGCMAKKYVFAICGTHESSSLSRLPAPSMVKPQSCCAITRSIYSGDPWVSWFAWFWSSIPRAGA
jgi:hypothetical protein